MQRHPAAAQIAAMILSAPAWAKAGITVGDERLRQRSADEPARIIAGNDGKPDDRQLPSL